MSNFETIQDQWTSDDCCLFADGTRTGRRSVPAVVSSVVDPLWTFSYWKLINARVQRYKTSSCGMVTRGTYHLYCQKKGIIWATRNPSVKLCFLLNSFHHSASMFSHIILDSTLLTSRWIYICLNRFFNFKRKQLYKHSIEEIETKIRFQLIKRI